MKELKRRINDPEIIEFTQRALGMFLDTGNPEVLLNGNVGAFIETPQELKPSPRVPDKEPSVDCTHHWTIGTPQGETSQGVCGHCEGTKEFLNYQPILPRQPLSLGGSKNFPRVVQSDNPEDLQDEELFKI